MCADYATPLYPQTLALTSPTNGGLSVGIVRSRSQGTEFVLFCFVLLCMYVSNHDIYVYISIYTHTYEYVTEACAHNVYTCM
jgi:hypothetical protein